METKKQYERTVIKKLSHKLLHYKQKDITNFVNVNLLSGDFPLRCQSASCCVSPGMLSPYTAAG